jgi:hypothetical protein
MQVSIANDRSQSCFTYDHVFGQDGSDPDELFPCCVDNLVTGLFKGYNATVLAYGSTGSGKTFTMGTTFDAAGTTSGVIPRVMDTIHAKIAETLEPRFVVRVSFVEIHKVLPIQSADLLHSSQGLATGLPCPVHCPNVALC